MTYDSTASSAIAALETILTLSTILSMLHEQISLPSTTKPPGPSSYTQPEIQLPKFGATYTCFCGVPHHDTDSNLIHTKQPILSILLHIIHTCHIISYKGSMSFKFFFSSPLPLQTSFKASIYIIWEEKKNNETFIKVLYLLSIIFLHHPYPSLTSDRN